MSKVMLGKEVFTAMREEQKKQVEALRAKGVVPKLAILRVGENPDDCSYERGAMKRMESTGIEVKNVVLPGDVSPEEFDKAFNDINEDDSIHGILMLRPLPKHINEEAYVNRINPRKDMDGMCPDNMAKIFAGDKSGMAPCTAEAVIRMLDHYKIDLTGKNVAVIGRSMVVGRPLAMLLVGRNATVTICHTRTKNLKDILKKSDIVCCAAGAAKMVSGDMLPEGIVAVDVGINVDENGKLCGDIDYESAEKKTAYISPVPRGVGSVTTSVLAGHVIKSAEYLLSESNH